MSSVNDPIRFESQNWDSIRVSVALVLNGITPTTGRSPTAALKRLSDGQWFNGTTWVASPTGFSLPEVDAVNFPGLYSLKLPASECDPDLDDEGYMAIVQYDYTGGGDEYTEYIHIEPTHAGADLLRMLGLRQQNMRVTNTAWDSTTGQPTDGSVKIYPTSADALADTNVRGEYSFSAAYDVSGRLTSYLGRKVS